MMHGGAITGMNIDRGDVAIAGEIRRHGEAAILVAIGRRRERLGISHDEIGIAENPAAAEVERRRKIGAISFRRAVVDPLRERGDVVGGENSRRVELAASGDRFPRRHDARGGIRFDLEGMRLRVGVRHQ